MKEKLEQIRSLVHKATLNSSKTNEWMNTKNSELMGFSPLYIVENGGADLLIEYLKTTLGLD